MIFTIGIGQREIVDRGADRRGHCDIRSLAGACDHRTRKHQ
jgi:hypothetical protein